MSGPITQTEVLAVLRRTTDDGWLNGMLNQPDGQAIIASKCAVFEAASGALMEQADACMISTAPSGCPGRCSLTLTCVDSSATATIPKGYKFVTSTGVELMVSLDVPVAAHQTSVTLPLESVRWIDLVNTVDPTFDDVLDVGDTVDDILSPDDGFVWDTLGVYLLGTGEGTLTYASSTTTVGAKMDWLSAHGDERGCHRQPNEDGEAYRLRVRAIPDAVTPIAIQEAVHGALSQGNLPPVYMVEPMRDQATDDARLAINLAFADSVFCDDSFCDDPLGVDVPGKGPFRTCETPSMREGRAYFRLAVAGALEEPDGSVLYCDDGFCDDPVWGYPDVLMHPVLRASLRAIQEEARVKKAGGVQFDTYIECVDVESTTGTGTSGTGVVVFTLTPDSSWLLRDGLVTCDAPSGHGLAPDVDPMFDPTTDAYKVQITLSDASVIDSGWSNAVDGMPLRLFELERIGYRSQQIIRIEGIVKSSAVVPLRLVGTFWVSPMTL
jgi:hypothetical protein